MKLLHTSDWHLGRSFHGVGTLAAQQYFADQLLATVRDHSVDVVLVAGDVYDRALPPVDVVNLFNNILVRLNKLGVSVVITSGNHDSATRLGFGGAILEQAGVHLRTRVQDAAVPVIFGLSHEAEVTAAELPQLLVYGIPYLEPRLVADELEVDKPSHFTVTEAAINRIKADIAQRTEGSVSIVMAHTFASGGLSSQSERELSIGGLGAIPLDLFDSFDYAALGHLHGRQKLSSTVRYSGSPLPYSFSETTHNKGAWLVDIEPEGVTSVREIDWAPQRALAMLKGHLSTLLNDPELEFAQNRYCQITLTDNHRPANAMEQLRTRFPHTLVLLFEPENADERAQRSYSQRVSQAVSELDLCCGFLDHVRERPASEQEITALQDALASVHAQESAL